MNNTISSTTSGWMHGSLVTSAHPCAQAAESPRTHLGQIWDAAVTPMPAPPVPSSLGTIASIRQRIIMRLSGPQPESKCIRHQIHLPEVHS